MTAVFLCGVYSGLQIAHVIERVKNSQNIDTVINTLFNEIIYKVIGIMTVAEHILTSEKHLKFCIGALFADKAKSVPRVLIKKAQAGVKGCTAPAFERMVTDLIHLFKYALKFIRSHSGRDQGLMRVSEDGFGNAYFCHTDSHSLSDYKFMKNHDSLL